MSDLQQISLCLRQVSSRSLILIDEFGKGTNESGLLDSKITTDLPFLPIYVEKNVTNYGRWDWVSLWGIRAFAQHELFSQGYRSYTLPRDF